MKRRPMVLAFLGGALAATAAAVMIAAGPGNVPVLPPHCIGGGLCDSNFAWRVWSDGRVELNDVHDMRGQADLELWKGWKDVPNK